MPRTCLTCFNSDREAIAKALVAGESLRNIAKRVSISPAGLLRHKSHVAGAIVKAQERRGEKLGDTICDEMRENLDTGILGGEFPEDVIRVSAKADYFDLMSADRVLRQVDELGTEVRADPALTHRQTQA